MPHTVNEILGLFESHGRAAYHGERVSQTEHALQAAMAAEADGAPPALITAALLHDIGHLLYQGDAAPAAVGIDDRHETFGAAWLERRFGPDVVEPIRLHVAAKRYLCSTDPGYHERLSPSSSRSLRLQGGPMSEDEVVAFEANPHGEAAVRLRRWDEAAKVSGLETPSLAHFRRYVEHLLEGE